jgi:predicted TIM-barrel fold metal-dependent hydrolase
MDFRLRPPLKGFLSMVMFSNMERSAKMAAGMGMELSPSTRQNSLDLLLKEMDEAKVVMGVVPGRISPSLGSVELADIVSIVKDNPKRFVGMAGIDFTNRKATIAAVDEAMRAGMKGIVLEPGLAAVPMYLDDRRLYPIYAHCEDKNIPVLFMSGGNAGPDPTYSMPEHIDHVAADFPGMKIISGHGNWPWVSEIIHVCYRRPNVYLSPDMYLYNGMPGAMDYINAANGFLADRFLFASAYPLTSLTQCVKKFLEFPLKDEVLDRVLYLNAARVLGLEK